MACKCDGLHAVLLRVESRLDSLDNKWERNNCLLEEHIRRTELLENTVKPLEKDFSRTKLIVYVALALASSAGLLGTYGKTLVGLFGIP